MYMYQDAVKLMGEQDSKGAQKAISILHGRGVTKEAYLHQKENEAAQSGNSDSRQKESACEKVGLNTGFKVNSRNFRIASVRVSGPWGNVK